MAKRRIDYESVFAGALRRILAYDSPAKMRRDCGRDWGLAFDEALEMAYENIKAEAKQALSGYRRRPDQPSA